MDVSYAAQSVPNQHRQGDLNRRGDAGCGNAAGNREESPIGNQLLGLEQHTRQLHATIEVLEQRLVSVLACVPSTNSGGPAEKIHTEPFHVIDRIDRATRLVADANVRLAELMQRLQV